MPFVPAPNIIQVEWRCTRYGQKIENRMMFDALHEPTAGDVQTLASTAWDWWENNHADVVPASVNLREVVATSMHALVSPQYTYAPDTTTVGNVGNPDLPNEVSLACKLSSGLRGRSARGRWFLLGMTTAMMANSNEAAATFAGQFAASLQQLINDTTGINFIPVIVSYRTNNAPRPGGPVYFIIQSATVVDLVVDSQKRRKPGVGA